MDGSERRYVDNTIQVPSAGLTIRQKEPKNLEAPFDQINSYLTPTELFYIRSHFPIPALDRTSYQLRIDGAVRRPFTLRRRAAQHAVGDPGGDFGVRRQ
jgi:DMSO/TMAO reductase YedYZ molybdopterin-dependent catalytic subunit